MKCPECQHTQKFKEGLVCTACGYRYALNPKEKPFLTDGAFKNILVKLSGPDRHYFTYSQLLAQVYRVFKKSAKKRRLGNMAGLGCLFIIAGIAGFSMLLPLIGDSIITSVAVALLFLAVVIAAGVWFARRPLKVSAVDAARVIHAYRSLHPIEYLADGKRFEVSKLAKDWDDALGFAPERILIVDRNDVADMLILNRFHFDNKTLVVSSEKYPRPAFAACQEVLMRFPDVPVALMHDTSRDGARMRERLLADRSWNLEGKDVKDLGLFVEDVSRLKDPVWLRPGMSEGAIFEDMPELKSADENVARGLVMPVDAAPPRAMMGVAAMAIVVGVALLSEELMAAQTRFADSGGGDFGFSGFG